MLVMLCQEQIVPTRLSVAVGERTGSGASERNLSFIDLESVMSFLACVVIHFQPVMASFVKKGLYNSHPRRIGNS